jgi:hypothetical protein
MRSLAAIALVALTGGFFGMPAKAQEERGQLWDVQTMSVRPDHMDEFMAQVGQIRAAAEAANLAVEYGWYVWVSGFDVMIASMAPDMASFDDPEAWMRQFQGTPGEAMVNQAMGTLMTEVAVQPGAREIYEHVEAWSYAPEEVPFDEPSYAQRYDYWIRPGMYEQFQDVAGRIMAFSAEMGSPYPVNGYRTHFGDAGRVTFLVFHDGWGDFYGEHSFESIVEAAGAAPRWEALMTDLLDCVSGYDASQMALVADLSYTGPGM